MKKCISIMLALILVVSFCSVSAFAVSISEIIDEQKATIDNFRTQQFSNAQDAAVFMVMLSSLVELHERGLEDEIYQNILNALDGNVNNSTVKSIPSQTEYDFGQGTFVVGQDLVAGTYDISCTSTSDSSYSDSMNAFSVFASAYGMDEYAGLFSSYSGLADALDYMTVTTYQANGMYDNYYTIKPGNSARIILTDGMKIEISDGNAHLTWIR